MNTTWTMDHKLLDQREKLRLGIWIRKLSREHAINCFWSAKSVCGIHAYDAMGMRKVSLLKLIGSDKPLALSKSTTFDVSQEFLPLGMEDTVDKIWTVLWLLSRKQSILDLWPMGVCSHGDKKV
jgi:hypothetical protein